MRRGQGMWRSKVDTRKSFFHLLSTFFSETRPPLNLKISVLAKLTGQRAPGFPRLCPSVAEVHVATSTLTLYLAFWGPELRSSCLCSEHFTHWFISLAQEVPVFQVRLRKKSTIYEQRKTAVSKIRSLFTDVPSSIPAEQSLSISASEQVKQSIPALSAVHQLCLLIFPPQITYSGKICTCKAFNYCVWQSWLVALCKQMPTSNTEADFFFHSLPESKTIWCAVRMLHFWLRNIGVGTGIWLASKVLTPQKISL